MHRETKSLCDSLYCDTALLCWSVTKTSVSLRCACMFISWAFVLGIHFAWNMFPCLSTWLAPFLSLGLYYTVCHLSERPSVTTIYKLGLALYFLILPNPLLCLVFLPATQYLLAYYLFVCVLYVSPPYYVSLTRIGTFC